MAGRNRAAAIGSRLELDLFGDDVDHRADPLANGVGHGRRQGLQHVVTSERQAAPHPSELHRPAAEQASGGQLLVAHLETIVPGIAAEAIHQIVDRLRRPLDPLQEMSAVEQQQAGNPVDTVEVASRAVNGNQLILVEIERREAGVGQTLILQVEYLPDPKGPESYLPII